MKNSLFHFHKETKETTDNMQNQDYKEYEHSDGYQNYGASQMMETIKAMGRNRQSRIRKV